MAKALILVVEDDESTAAMVRSVLDGEHYNVSVARSGMQARSLVEKCRPDLVLLDRNLPDTDGLELCRELRAKPETQAMPILFLTGKKSLSEKVLGLRMGGDDYLTKPFGPEELVARVEALLRRTQATSPGGTGLVLGDLEMSVESRTAALNGKPLDLTNKEYDLLRTFVERRGRVLTRSFLLSHIWGYDLELSLNTKVVDMMIVGLRRKLGKWGDRIETVRGHGYRLRPPEED